MNNNKQPIRPNIEEIPLYSPGRSAEEAQREYKISGVIKLASNENPFGPSPKALEAMKKYSKDMNIYPDKGCLELKDKIAGKLGLSTDNIVIGNGSDELMLLAGLAFLSAKEEVIISKNTFSTYEMVARLMDGTPVFVDLKNNAYDLNAMAGAITGRTKLIFICSPNNPTGTISAKKDMDAFLSKVPSNVIIIIDEAYGDYAASRDYPDSLEYIKSKKNVLVLRTFSKIYGLAGLRVGYGTASPDIIKYLDMVRLPFSVNRLAQLAAIAALNDGDFVKRSLKNNEDGKAYLYSELDGLGVAYQKTEANFICIKLDEKADVVFVDLMRSGVIIRPLTSFGMNNSIRVTIGTPDQNQRFIKALKKVLGKG